MSLAPYCNAFRGGRLIDRALSRASAAAIYTQGRPMSAPTIVGKSRSQHSPRTTRVNPGVIADNNVGDKRWRPIAGMGADIYESYVAAIVAAMGARV